MVSGEGNLRKERRQGNSSPYLKLGVSLPNFDERGYMNGDCIIAIVIACALYLCEILGVNNKLILLIAFIIIAIPLVYIILGAKPNTIDWFALDTDNIRKNGIKIGEDSKNEIYYYYGRDLRINKNSGQWGIDNKALMISGSHYYEAKEITSASCGVLCKKIDDGSLLCFTKNGEEIKPCCWHNGLRLIEPGLFCCPEHSFDCKNSGISVT